MDFFFLVGRRNEGGRMRVRFRGSQGIGVCTVHHAEVGRGLRAKGTGSAYDLTTAVVPFKTEKCSKLI